MAFIPLSNGGALPVFATDVLNGPLNNSPTPNTYPQTVSGAVGPDLPVPTTNFAGPKYDFFKISFNKAPGAPGSTTAAGGDISLSAGVAQAAQLLLQTIQNGGSAGVYVGSGGTISMYSIAETLASNSADVSVALFPTGAYNNSTTGGDDSSAALEAVINGLGIVTFQDGTVFDFTTATGGLAVSQPGFVLA